MTNLIFTWSSPLLCPVGHYVRKTVVDNFSTMAINPIVKVMKEHDVVWDEQRFVYHSEGFGMEFVWDEAWKLYRRVK